MAHFSSITDEKEFIDAYSYYYGHKGKGLEKNAVDIKDVKLIHARHFY